MANYEVNGIQFPSVTTILGQLDKSAGLLPWAVKMMSQRINEELDKHTEGIYAKWTPEAIKEIVETGRREYRNVSQKAMDIGSEVHDRIKEYILNGRDAVGNMPDEVENAFIAFLDWEKDNVIEWLESEKKVYHPLYYYAGTLDAIVRMKDGKVRLIDFKTSKGFYDGMAEQVAAYKEARQMMTPDSVVNYKHTTKETGTHSFDVGYGPITIHGTGILRLDKETGLPEFKDYDKVQENKYKAFGHLLDFYYAQKKRRLKNNPRVLD